MENIINKISVNRTLELGLKEFAGRCNIEDIDDFVTVFCEGKRNGADFKDMIAKSVYMIRSKKETEKEIDVMLSGKQFEQKVMSIIPLLIVSYMKLTNDEFIEYILPDYYLSLSYANIKKPKNKEDILANLGREDRKSVV